MKVLKSLLLFLLLMLGVGYIGSQLLLNKRAPENNQQVNILDPQLIQRGKYIARTADCIG